MHDMAVPLSFATPVIAASRRFALVIAALGALGTASGAVAAERVRLFQASSLAQIVAERQGRPFILALWSVTCTHCPEELRTLGRLKAANPKLDVVLVATDTPEDAPHAAELARGYGLGNVPQWVFADEMPERLRYEIDRRWYGELPRTYLYDRQHNAVAVSGLVPKAQLDRWVKENVR